MEALYKYCSGCVAAIAALFAPVVPMIWALVGFIGWDFLTGVMASYREARRYGKPWYFESREAWRTIEKLGFSIISLCMAFTIDTLLLGFMELHLTNLLAGFICEVDGDSSIRIDEEELATAEFIAREKIDMEYTDSSLTNEMICAFKNNKY
jgi:hypothetical protein